jgi:hypothetical protein
MNPCAPTAKQLLSLNDGSPRQIRNSTNIRICLSVLKPVAYVE